MDYEQLKNVGANNYYFSRLLHQDLNLLPSSTSPTPTPNMSLLNPPPPQVLAQVHEKGLGFQLLTPAVDLNHSCDESDEEADKRRSAGGGRGVIIRGGNTKVCARGHWRPAEDAKLKELVSQFGPQNWNLIADHLQGRSGKSCRLRWYNQLDPRINRTAFNDEEEERLLSAHRLYGNKWALIARLFPGRTDNAVKNHWHVIMARKQRADHHHHHHHHSTAAAGPYRRIRKAVLLRPPYDASSNRGDDCALSTCTDLSLSPSSSAAAAAGASRLLFSRCTQLAGPPPAGKSSGDDITRSSGGEVQCNDNSNSETTNSSDVTAVAESSPPALVNKSAGVAEYSSSSSVQRDDDDDERRQLIVPFIDFLGVGAA